MDGAVLPRDLDGTDWAILCRWTERETYTAMGKALGVSVQTIRARVARPSFQHVLARLQRNLFDQLSRGEFGALAIFKANAVGAAKRIVGLSRMAINETVKLNANLEIVKHAGIQPPKPVVLDNPERLFDQMTADELDHFARTDEIPKRLMGQVARFAVKAIEERTGVTVDGEVERQEDGEGAEYDGTHVPKSADPPPEVVDRDDEVAGWRDLPDETDLGEDEHHGTTRDRD